MRGRFPAVVVVAGMGVAALVASSCASGHPSPRSLRSPAEGTEFSAFVTDQTENSVDVFGVVGHHATRYVQPSLSSRSGHFFGPDQIAADPLGRYVVVGNYGTSENKPGTRIVPIDARSGRPFPPLVAGTRPSALAISSDGSTVWVAHNGGVTRVDVGGEGPNLTFSVGSTYRAPGYFRSMVVLPGDRQAFVGDYGVEGVPRLAGHLVYPLDLTTGAFGPGIEVGPNPCDMTASTDGRTVYVTTEGPVGATSDRNFKPMESMGYVVPIDVRSGRAGTPIPVGTGPSGIRLFPDGIHALVAVDGSGMSVGNVAVVDLARGVVVSRIPVGIDPWTFWVAAGGKSAWVIDAGSDDMRGIDLTTLTAGSAVRTGRHPHGIAVVSAVR